MYFVKLFLIYYYCCINGWQSIIENIYEKSKFVLTECLGEVVNLSKFDKIIQCCSTSIIIKLCIEILSWRCIWTFDTQISVWNLNQWLICVDESSLLRAVIDWLVHRPKIVCHIYISYPYLIMLTVIRA